MRRYLVMAAILCLASYGVGLWLGSYVQDKRSMASFKVDIPDGTTVKVFRDLGGDGPFRYDPSKPLFTLTSDRRLITKSGVYDFVIEPGKDYQVNVVRKTVNTSVRSVAINPAFSQSKLATELAAEKGGILGALFTRLGKAPIYYAVDKLALFEQGEWAGVTLKPKSAKFDPARFVLNKKGGSWRVVNEPSILVIGSLNKSVPPGVVASVNSL
ncbi:MAG TPA: hypothetical protein VFX84_02600 [Candidatus Saccharimonadales bacterium]|nr:hypothetical protein [Candidatus Saccharimonadales bacterium]